MRLKWSDLKGDISPNIVMLSSDTDTVFAIDLRKMSRKDRHRFRNLPRLSDRFNKMMEKLKAVAKPDEPAKDAPS